MSQELQTQETASSLQNWSGLKSMAETFIKSGLAPQSIRTPEQAVIVAAQGRELGVPFMASMRAINVIQNRPAASVQLKLGLAMRTGELEDFTLTPQADKIVAMIKRKGRSAITTEFGAKEAKAMKLIGKDNYEKQAMTMFQWRALGLALDIAFADVLLGLETSNKTFLSISTVDSNQDNFVYVDEHPAPESTAAQEEVKAHSEYVEAKKIEESGGGTWEAMTLVQQIKDMLGKMNRGELQSMNEHLKSLTTYSNGTKWVDIDSLENIAIRKPDWLLKIHQKVKSEFEKNISTE